MNGLQYPSRRRNRTHRLIGPVLALMLLFSLAGLTVGSAATTEKTEYVVVYAEGTSLAAAREAVRAAGGSIVSENATIGVATVSSTNANFMADVAGQGALVGAARNRPIGHTPNDARPTKGDLERMQAERDKAVGAQPQVQPIEGPAGDPLADLQWDMQRIGATMAGSYAKELGDDRVLVGIMDTGIDGSHPDIAPNFDAALSRNFTTDMPDIDGPCEYDLCKDPADVDNDGHGTHVAGTVGAALNGIGIAGVAPDVTLVNIRAGQDSGYFFLQATIDAMVYAGDIGIDVINMSFYTDPWLFNCADNPADSPEAQAEQRTVVAATQRAANYARNHGVTLVSALGNEHVDLGNPLFDDTSPDYPPGAAYERDVDNSCITVPTETDGVISVSSLGPSDRLAYYSSYGTEQTDVSAPGGDYYDDAFAGDIGPANMILSAYPEELAWKNGELWPGGEPNNPFVIRDCEEGVCAYYQYLQGTSMASPHAAGVAALIVSAHGRVTPKGMRMSPKLVEATLYRTATNHPCPVPRLYVYDPPIPSSYSAYCAGMWDDNGFYGNGIVNALRAVRGGH
jgi:lantibiotic leader peptide-processing serine protease